MIVFISDNGVDARPQYGLGGESARIAESNDNSLANMGGPGSFVSYGSSWAEVGSYPFRLHKGMTTEGGIRVPAIIRLPESLSGRFGGGTIKREFISVMDLLPTCLDVAETKHPGVQYQGRKILPVVGESILGYLLGRDERICRENPFGFIVHERQGLQFDKWKLLQLPSPLGSGEWELYDLEADPGETNNLVKSQPDVIRDTVAR